MVVYVCRRCGAEFEDEDELDKHIKQEFEDGSEIVEYVCGKCGAIFGIEEELYEHIEEKHR